MILCKEKCNTFHIANRDILTIKGPFKKLLQDTHQYGSVDHFHLKNRKDPKWWLWHLLDSDVQPVARTRSDVLFQSNSTRTSSSIRTQQVTLHLREMIRLLSTILSQQGGILAEMGKPDSPRTVCSPHHSRPQQGQCATLFCPSQKATFTQANWAFSGRVTNFNQLTQTITWIKAQHINSKKKISCSSLCYRGFEEASDWSSVSINIKITQIKMMKVRITSLSCTN